MQGDLFDEGKDKQVQRYNDGSENPRRVPAAGGKCWVQTLGAPHAVGTNPRLCHKHYLWRQGRIRKSDFILKAAF